MNIQSKKPCAITSFNKLDIPLENLPTAPIGTQMKISLILIPAAFVPQSVYEYKPLSKEKARFLIPMLTAPENSRFQGDPIRVTVFRII
jgi:hypothetical protein